MQLLTTLLLRNFSRTKISITRGPLVFCCFKKLMELNTQIFTYYENMAWFESTKKLLQLAITKTCKYMWKLVEIVSNRNLFADCLFLISVLHTLIILENHLIFLNIATTGWPTMTKISKCCPNIYLIFFILSRSNQIWVKYD